MRGGARLYYVSTPTLQEKLQISAYEWSRIGNKVRARVVVWKAGRYGSVMYPYYRTAMRVLALRTRRQKRKKRREIE